MGCCRNRDWSTFSWRGFLVLIGGFTIHLTFGTMYTFGNINTYITSYLRHSVSATIVYSDTVWVLALIVMGHGLLMPLGGVMSDRIGPRLTALFGCSILSSGVLLTYYSIGAALWLVMLTYGLLFGFGIALAYAQPLTAGMRWFPERKGLVNGFIVGGFGFGAFIFNQVQTAFLNPSNVNPQETGPDAGYFTDPDILARVPQVFLLLGVVYFIMQLVGCSLITNPPFLQYEHIEVENTEVGLSMTDEEEDILYDAEEKRKKGPVSFTPRQMLKTKEFYLLWFTFLTNQQCINYINSMYKAYGQTFIEDDQFLAMVGAFAAVFNSCGRLMWGYLMDRSSYKVCMLSLTALLTLLFLTINLTPYGGKPMFTIWVWAIFLVFCGNFSLMPTATAETFGSEHATTNYGLVFTSNVISGPLTAILTQVFSDRLGFSGVFIMMAGFAVVSFILTCFFPKRTSLPRQ